jgi:murein DD-endopeptidase MepM/ murein hydrolase activator NlpD
MSRKTISPILILIIILSLVLASCSPAVPEQEEVEFVESEFHGVLTPKYYLPGNDELKDEIDNFLYYAMKVKFFHPLNDIQDELTTPLQGNLGSKKQLPGISDHHHAGVDLHPTTAEVNIYAAHDGYLTRNTYPEIDRHNITIIKDITDDDGKLIGKLVTTYLHLNLDKDPDDLVALNNQHVNKGDLICQHLYSETLGGPHLHFEIRYYRPGESGTERFYGTQDPRDAEFNLTLPSAGPWIYGYWNEDIGYGFGFPSDHGLDIKTVTGPFTAPPYGRPEPKQEDVEAGIIQQDVFTPKYYQPGNDELKDEIDNFISYAQKVTLFHPLNDIKDEVEIPADRSFGVGRGPTGTEEHNSGVEFVPINTISEIKIYAAHDGYLTSGTHPFFHHYISIVKDIVDDDGNLLGKLATIYANLDLDKDPAELIALNNQYVNKGDLISQNLWAEANGGLNLHFEIRYYRSGDSGFEIFYGPDIPPYAEFNLTLPSAGPWSYGKWNENIGYGLGYPVFNN